MKNDQVTYRAASSVLWCSSETMAIVLCLATNKFHQFNSTAADIWNRLSHGGDYQSVTQGLCAAYPGVPASVIERDVQRTVAEFCRRRLLTTERCDLDDTADIFSAPVGVSSSPAEGPLDHQGLFSLVVMLMLIRASILTLGLQLTLRWIARISKGRATRIYSQSALQAVARAVAFAAPLSPFRGECLERALCMLWVARKSGAQVTLRFGVQPHPFSGHVWLEQTGVPVNDHAEHTKLFIPLERSRIVA